MRSNATDPTRRAGVIVVAPMLVAILAFAILNAAGAEESERGRPNILVIVADDLGWNDIGYHGSEVRTPNLDRLAAEGARFSQFYAYSTCSPTRAALLSGRNPARFKIHGPLASDADLGPDDMHLSFGLREAGYSTHISGKWHLGETPEHKPMKHGFDTTYGYLRGQIDPYTHRYKFGDHVTWHRNDRFIEEDGHVTDLIADEAERVIETAAEVREKPFFLYVAHHAPHYPMNEPPKWITPYEDVFEDVWRQHQAAAITHMDHTVGQLVDALERTGQREDTLIIFFSDNGGAEEWSAPDNQYNGRYAAHTALGDNTPLRGWKTSLYEGGIRVPALANWPGSIEAGREIEAPTHVLDLAPTLLHLAGADLRDDGRLDGTNLTPILLGKGSAETLSDRRFYWRQGRLRAVRDGDWKLIARGDDLNNPRLFNVADDPHEQHELGQEQPERRDRMLDLLKTWPEW